MLYFRQQDLGAVLPELLKVWPEDGCCTARQVQAVQVVADRWPDGPVRINPAVDRQQLRRAGRNLVTTAAYSTPWKYQKLFSPNTNIRQQAVKIRPNTVLPIVIDGHPTTAVVKRARRLKNYKGKPYYMTMELNVNTENIPIILDRESKCTCVFCGTPPQSDEESCRSCGAPLPSC